MVERPTHSLNATNEASDPNSQTSFTLFLKKHHRVCLAYYGNFWRFFFLIIQLIFYSHLLGFELTLSLMNKLLQWDLTRWHHLTFAK